MDEATKAMMERSVAAAAESLGLKNIPAGELEIMGEAVIGLIHVLGGAALKRAAAAGEAAAAKITTAAEAEQAERDRR